MIEKKVADGKETKEMNIMIILKNSIDKIRREQDKLLQIAKKT